MSEHDGDKKRKRGGYYKAGGSQTALPHGAAGVLISSDQGKERATCHALTELLVEARALTRAHTAAPAADEPRPPPPPPHRRRCCAQIWEAQCPAPAAEPAGGDAAAALAAEVAGLRDGGAGQRFQVADPSTKGLSFLRLSAAAAASPSAPRVVDLVHALLSGAAAAGPGRLRFAHRLLPVETVCFASVEEVTKAARPLLGRLLGEEGPARR